MLVIDNKGQDLWDETTEKFVKIPGFKLTLEHSLISLSKWETKYMVPFLGGETKTNDHIFDYIKIMVKSANVDVEDLTLERFTPDELKAIQEYIDSPESATTFGQMPTKSSPKEVITAELIYYWMVAFTIPWEAQEWHLNRLFALIRICNVKQSKPEKRPLHEVAQQYADLNRQRKEALKTAG